MNKFLKKITKKQLEEILSTFAGREIEIVSDNINLFEDKLVVEFSFISDEYKYIVQKHFLDDFSTLNIYKQTSYIENIDFIAAKLPHLRKPDVRNN